MNGFIANLVFWCAGVVVGIGMIALSSKKHKLSGVLVALVSLVFAYGYVADWPAYKNGGQAVTVEGVTLSGGSRIFMFQTDARVETAQGSFRADAAIMDLFMVQGQSLTGTYAITYAPNSKRLLAMVADDGTQVYDDKQTVSYKPVFVLLAIAIVGGAAIVNRFKEKRV